MRSINIHWRHCYVRLFESFITPSSSSKLPSILLLFLCSCSSCSPCYCFHAALLCCHSPRCLISLSWVQAEEQQVGSFELERTKKADKPIISGIPPTLAVNRLWTGGFNNPDWRKLMASGSLALPWWSGSRQVAALNLKHPIKTLEQVCLGDKTLN